MWELPTRAKKSAETSSARAVDPSPNIFRQRARLTSNGDLNPGDGWRMDYAAATGRLLASYRSIPPTATIRLAKRTSNLFRTRQALDTPGLDVSGLDGVLVVDAEAMTAD